MSAGASYVAIAMAEQARLRRLEECRRTVDLYDHANATLGERREYAKCLLELYPDDTAASPYDRAAAAFCLIVALVCGGIGGYYGYHDKYMPTVACGIGIIMGGACGLIFIAIGYAIFAAVAFILGKKI
jgi:hypothetical protein